MAFILIENGVVVQKQTSPAEGFVKAPDSVICGQILQPDGSYANPPLPPAVEKERRRAEIITALADIDLKSIRPLRAGETEKLAELDEQAQALRAELATL